MLSTLVWVVVLWLRDRRAQRAALKLSLTLDAATASLLFSLVFSLDLLWSCKAH